VDNSRVVRLTRALGIGSRRQALQGAAVATGALLAARVDGAAKKGMKKRCRKKKCPTCVPLALGSRCSTARDCCGTETNLSCAATETGNPSGTVCCGTAGVACGLSDDNCCSGFLCVNGACAGEP
jgi:hypothetical protein